MVVLHVGNAEVGVLNAIATAAYPVLGLFAGVLMDRIRRRPAMIVADLVRCAAFATLPVAAAFDALSLTHLYVVAAVSGVFSVLFDVAYQSYLPTLLTGEPLARGNTRLEMSSSVSRLTGPTIGGALQQGLAATGALAANALSFLASVVGVLLVRTTEPAPAAHATSTGVWRPIAEGLRFLWHHPLLRPLTLAAGLRNFGMSVVRTVLLLFLYRALSLSPGVAGAVLTAGAVAAVAGATLSGRLTRRLGVGRTLLLTGCEGLAWLAVPLALVLPPLGTVVTIMVVSSLWLPIWNALVTTLRQQVTEPRLLGRVHASARTINLSTLPLGALAGGALAQLLTNTYGNRIGLTLALTTGAAVAALSLPTLLAGKIRRIHHYEASVPTAEP
ncbi:MFS transporter [Streptomyces sp. KC 17012]|uniref:MFS transporter n=1 Tax=Streptomyces plumbidurans TaxID=2814589 RepID=UPI001C9E1322|nr:MFS transporter [Streptomyces plumbidurans]MBY8339581.1 MFS transporter [Streptomyces plumbidurans]